jgi:glycosyltransferase involved in cell wall biosynthesis
MLCLLPSPLIRKELMNTQETDTAVKRPVLVISQVPPPHHGSTVMTQVFLETLSDLRLDGILVDRRFSTSVASVGRFSFRKVGAGFDLFRRVVRAARTERPSRAVLFMTNRPASFLVDVVIAELLRVFRVPVVGYIHTQGFEALAARGRIWQALVARLLGGAQTLVCLSPILEQDVRRLAPGTALVSIGNTPLDTPRDNSRELNAELRVVFLSNLIPEKGVDEFLDLARSFNRMGPDAEFIAAGAPAHACQLDELRQSAPENARIMGPADTEQKWDLLSNSDLIVFPSRYPFEAQPLVLVEAMAMGLPCVAYGIGGIPDLITAESGIVVKPGDRPALRNAVNLLLSDDTLRRKMGESARARYESHFSRDAYRNSWASVVQDW